jgi:hypothetical protein
MIANNIIHTDTNGKGYASLNVLAVDLERHTNYKTDGRAVRSQGGRKGCWRHCIHETSYLFRVKLGSLRVNDGGSKLCGERAKRYVS